MAGCLSGKEEFLLLVEETEAMSEGRDECKGLALKKRMRTEHSDLSYYKFKYSALSSDSMLLHFHSLV